MIDAAKPGQEVVENDLIKELVKTLKGMEENLIKLITSVEHEVVMNMTLLINDDLHKTLSRYKKAAKGSKPEPFVPAESTPQGSMINPSHLYEAPETKRKATAASAV
jgi:hypothetical protein